jgi:cation transport protein ChaC
MVFQVARDQVPHVLAYLWAREMASNVYRPKLLPVRLESGARVSACAFVVDRAHPQYCRNLDLEQSAALIRQGVGGRGPNIDYLINTVEHLTQLGITDHGLEALLAAVTAGGPGAT